MSVYITDTHSLLWFTLNKHSSLSKKALAVFQSAAKGESFIYIPVIVLWGKRRDIIREKESKKC